MLDHIQQSENDKTLSQLREFIDQGGYAPGDRLPSERDLIISLNIPRNKLRKCLDILEHEGTIWRHVGKGTFITAQHGKCLDPDLSDLTRLVTPVQLIRARLSLEPAIAREAAANASAEAVTRLQACKDRAVAATSWASYESEDDAFHRVIAESTGNVLLLSLFDHLNQVRRAVAWQNVVRNTERPARDHASFAEHDRILNAIEERNPVESHAAMRDHIASVSQRLYGQL